MTKLLKAVAALTALAAATPAAAAYYDFQVTVAGAYVCQGADYVCADLGGTPLTGSPADFGQHIAAENEKWGKVIRAANIRAE